MEMQKTYNPKDFEDRIYADWEKSGYFRAEIDADKVPFTIMMPPPNITGQLHMGHAMDATMQDTLIRFKRMQGYAALWLPGCDHASIATEVKIVEKMKQDGLTKADLGRDGFLKRAWEWKDKYYLSPLLLFHRLLGTDLHPNTNLRQEIRYSVNPV